MIINGGSRCNWRFFAKHLMKTDENDRVSIAEIRGLAAESVLEGLREMGALASGTRCKNFFYHANLNPRADERLDDSQWERAVDHLEQNLGLVGHSRLVVEHEKEGRRHRHVIWSRIDVDSMTAVSDSHNFRAHEQTARGLEQEFGHEPVIGVFDRDKKRPKRRAKNWETFRGHGSGIDPEQMTREITALWRQADSGKAFAASLTAAGYVLCKGDRRAYCLVDSAGDVHSLARRIDSTKAAEIRNRLQELPPEQVPSIDQARQQAASMRARHVDQELQAESRKGSEPPRSPLEAFAETVKQTMRSNNGELHHHDGLSWWDRTITVINAIRDRAADWLVGRWQDMFDRAHQDHVSRPHNERDR